MDVSIKYKLVGRGWSECTVDIYGQVCTVTASYLSDALKEFVWAVNYMLKGGLEIKFNFDEEPGEYRWILARLDEKAISISILDFEELWSNKEDSLGNLIYEVSCPMYDFAMALKTDLDNVLDEHGLDGYREKWGNAGFPFDDYKELCSLLGKPPSNKGMQSDRPKPASRSSVDR